MRYDSPIGDLLAAITPDREGMRTLGGSKHPNDGRPGVLRHVQATGIYVLDDGISLRGVPRAWAEDEARRLLAKRD